jgi:hypothetical protein
VYNCDRTYDLADVAQRLDTSSEMTIPDDASLAVSQTVLYLLGNLPEPLLPLWLQPVCLGASDRDEAFAALEGVAAVNTNVRDRSVPGSGL